MQFTHAMSSPKFVRFKCINAHQLIFKYVGLGKYQRQFQMMVRIKYNDKDLKINWPIKNPIISKKDKNNLSFKEFKDKTKLNDN